MLDLVANRKHAVARPRGSAAEEWHLEEMISLALSVFHQAFRRLCLHTHRIPQQVPQSTLGTRSFRPLCGRIMHATSNIKIRRKLGPHSRLLQRGVIGRSIDGRSTEGRYLRDFEARSIQHLGGSPSTTEQLLITRLARIALRIELFEEKMLSGNFTDHDGRVLAR